MIASRTVDGLTLFPFVHAGALAVWVVSQGARLSGTGGALGRLARSARYPAAAVALFAAIALFHRHPEHWFTVAGKLRAAIIVGVLALDAATEPARQRWTPEAVSARAPRRALLVFGGLAALTQLSLSWVKPWPI